MTYIYWLSQIQYAEQSLVGDKLFILSQLLQCECPVLPGFVLGNNLWREFLAQIENELLIEDFPNDYQTLQSLASRSSQSINQANFPGTWQTEIFQAAQQLNSDSLILQPFITTTYGQGCLVDSLWRSHTCNNNPEALSTAIKLVWSELFTAMSLLYWQKLGLNIDQVDLSILVRPLKTAYASGMVEVSNDLIQIKASWGLGKSLFQGDVEPDVYIIDREMGYILSQSLGHKNYAYRPKNVDLHSSLVDCLEAYIPGENLAETFVLEHNAIAKLLQLIQNILEQQPQIKSLAWTTFESSASSVPHFYFTGFNDYLTSAISTTETIIPHISAPPSIPPLLSGVAASPGKVQGEVVVVKDFDTYPEPIPAASILVTKVINPQHISLIKQTGGIITEIGGKTSHGAIVARELNIPAIVNVVDATKILNHGDKVLLNGDNGHVYPATKHQQLQQLISRPSFKRIFSPAYPIATKLMVNLSQPESIAATSNLPIDGVGLLRAEFMLADLLATQISAKWQYSCRNQLLNSLTNSLRQFTAAFTPFPVFYRSLDRYAEDSIDPILGIRGTYSYLTDPTLFDLELEALKIITAEGYGNLNLILPFVRSVDEFEFCYRRIENAGLTTLSSFQVWIMAEVPSVIMLLPEYIRAGVQGIAIGTNDLTQLLLGVNREQTQLSDRGLNANHPAMQKVIAELIKTAHDHNIECCICGQAPVEHPDLIDKLIRWGVDTISVEPEAVNRTYKAIARAERRLLLNEVRD
ncbi:MAG: putative PEP-binding protein [Waterburya sp.]